MTDTKEPAEHTPTVLLVEDDRGLRESLAMVLRSSGLVVAEADSAERAKPALVTHDPDLVILDVNLPGQDGMELMREMRSGGDARQVLLLTARHEVADRVMGLDAGADDYLAKPFALDELLARVRLLLRRALVHSGSAHLSTGAAIAASGVATDSSGSMMSLGPVDVATSARRVTVSGAEVELTKLEYDFLVLLIEHVDQVMTREIIHERVWGYEADYASNTLEVLVSSLRRKLEVGESLRIVHTVRGVGYVARLPKGHDSANAPAGST